MYGDDTLIVVIKSSYFPARNNHDRGKREFAFSLLLVTLSIKKQDRENSSSARFIIIHLSST